MFDLQQLIRPNILRLKPYTTARHDFAGQASVFLDANENSIGSAIKPAINRYPDPLQKELKQKIATLKGVEAHQIFIGNGSDEPIDLLFRIFCEPGVHQAIICSPTYGMYGVSAAIHNTPIIDVPLLPDFSWDIQALLRTMQPNTRLLFICSPNNPTGNSIPREDLKTLLENFPGIVCVDEAYIDFSVKSSALNWLEVYPNLVVIQTFSKAWGAAAARIGLAFASSTLIHFMNHVKAPYNISAPIQQIGLELIERQDFMQSSVQKIIAERERLAGELRHLSVVEKVFPSDANFLLVRFIDAKEIYHKLLGKGIVVRDRSNLIHCAQCLRITIGTPSENNQLLTALSEL
jgi:histidinol-phosphate aminotransferase